MNKLQVELTVKGTKKETLANAGTMTVLWTKVAEMNA